MPLGISSAVQAASVVTPGSNMPMLVKPSQLDNPPRTRVMSSGAAPVQAISNQTFAGLSFVDLLTLRAALNNHLSTLAPGDITYLESTKRVLAMVSEKLSPSSPIAGLGAAPLIPSMIKIKAP